jgi:hypothetical protein
MAQLVAGPKELNLNKPKVFDGNQDGFKEFLQNVEVYMDINHETYNNNLRKIAFVLSFMTTGQLPHGRPNSSMTPTPNLFPPTLTTG